MKINNSIIELVVSDLLSNNKNKLAFELLDFYYSKCKTIQDFELIGKLSLKNYYYSLSIKCAETVYSLSKTSEELYISRINLAKAYLSANYPEKALFYNYINLTLKPNDFESIVSYAAALKFNGQRYESEEIIDKLYTTDLTDEQKYALEITQTNKQLRQGNIGKGIELFLRDDREKVTTFDLLGMKKWNGVIQPNRKIYVYDQGGYGDGIINIRFFEYLKKYGMKPILFSLLERKDIYDVYINSGIDVETETFLIDTTATWANLLELPIDLDLKEDQLWYGSYIKFKNNNIKLKSKKFKIGIKCNGNKYFAQDIYRSIPIEEMIGIMPNNAEIYLFDQEKTHNLTINLKDKLNTWNETYNYIDQMDLIVSSCTSLVHAAGSIGKNTIVITPITEYYIWTSSRTDNTTPWYGNNLHVIKQIKPRDWSEPLLQAKKLINLYYNKND
jgi:hypothetical protein